jgi:hypothetical protein
LRGFARCVLPTAFEPDGLLLRAFGRCAHFGFRVDAQGVGHAVDVIEIGNDLDGVQNVAVAEPVLAEGVDVLPADGRGCSRDEVGEICQGLAARRELGLQIVLPGVFGQFRVTAFSTEILPVSFRSIEAVVGPGNHDGHQFAFSARKP